MDSLLALLLEFFWGVEIVFELLGADDQDGVRDFVEGRDLEGPVFFGGVGPGGAVATVPVGLGGIEEITTACEAAGMDEAKAESVSEGAAMAKMRVRIMNEPRGE